MPPVPAAGVPDSSPVAGVKVTPFGRLPVTLEAGAGLPEAVTVKVPAAPTLNVTASSEVNSGPSSTLSVTDKVAATPTPLSALIVTR